VYSIGRYVLRIIAFRFIPNSVVSKPVAAVWGPLVSKPFNRLPRAVKLALGWLALLGIVFGSAFGFSLPQVCLLQTARDRF
jgi:CNT family concentrative nucleoside transporter